LTSVATLIAGCRGRHRRNRPDGEHRPRRADGDLRRPTRTGHVVSSLKPVTCWQRCHRPHGPGRCARKA